MHIFCPNCGKHIDVSIQEIEKLEGHYVCPQCLIEIDLEGFEQNAADFDYFDDEAQQDGYVKDPVQQEPSQPVASDNSASTATTLAQPPAYKPAASNDSQQYRDDVMRYCKNCGTFLRKGINYCPKCGKYVKVQPPAYQGPRSPLPSPHSHTSPLPSHPSSGNYNYDYRNRVRQPMASSTRKPSKSNRNRSDNETPKGIFSIGGCITFTIIVVAIFFIVYILLGDHGI